MPHPAHISPVEFLCSLHKCRTERNVALALQLHDACTHKKGLLDAHPSLGNHLISVLVQFGHMTHARQVFDSLTIRDQMSWYALITGYVKHGDPHLALSLYQKMQEDPALRPNRFCFISLLKACGALHAIEVGTNLHGEIAKLGLLDRDIVVGSSLVDMYVKFGFLEKAQEVFDKLPAQDVVSWTLLIAGYVEHGHGKKAFHCYERMKGSGVAPDAFTFVCLLRACCSVEATIKGPEVHAEIVMAGFEKELLVGNTLVDMYAKCGLLQTAHYIFESLSVRDVVSWNALIAGFTEQRYGERALYFLHEMHRQGISGDAVTFVCSLKACCTIEDAILKGREIHIEIVRKGLETEVLVSSTLVNMYAKSGLLAEAQAVFDMLAVPNVVLCNALMSGYVEHGSSNEALDFFDRLQQGFIYLNAITYIFGLKSCSTIGTITRGEEIHADILKRGLERDLLVGSSVVDMYAKCGALAEAQEVFNKLPVQDVVAWTALLTGYAEHGHDKEVLDCYEKMRHDCISSNAITCVCILKACSNIGCPERGLKLHADIVRKGLECEVLVGSSLVEMYAKFNLLDTAHSVFDKLSVQDPMAWNALISGYVEHGVGDRALLCLEQAQLKSIYLNAITLLCSLKACGIAGAAAKGELLHVEITKRGVEGEKLAANTLVDTYAKCGLLAEAHKLFEKMPARDVVSWTSLISGYAQLGRSKNVFDLLGMMIAEDVKPNHVTCISVLNACSHGGLINEGCMFFEGITTLLGFSPTVEHYTCIVDLLGRAGHLDKAVAVIWEMPLHPDIMSWQKVLGACRKWGDVELGRQAYEHALRLDERGTAAYVCMSNIFADASIHN